MPPSRSRASFSCCSCLARLPMWRGRGGRGNPTSPAASVAASSGSPSAARARACAAAVGCRCQRPARCLAARSSAGFLFLSVFLSLSLFLFLSPMFLALTCSTLEGSEGGSVSVLLVFSSFRGLRFLCFCKCRPAFLFVCLAVSAYLFRRSAVRSLVLAASPFRRQRCDGAAVMSAASSEGPSDGGSSRPSPFILSRKN